MFVIKPLVNTSIFHKSSLTVNPQSCFSAQIHHSNALDVEPEMQQYRNFGRYVIILLWPIANMMSDILKKKGIYTKE